MIIKDHLGDFGAIDGVWDTLLSSTESHVFFTPLWARIWWRNLGSGESHLLQVLKKDRPVGIIPLLVRGKKAALLGDKEVCDYLDVVALRGEEGSVARELFRFAEDNHLTLDLLPLLEDSPLVSHIRSIGQGDRLTAMDTSYWLELPATWEEYFEMLSGKNRHELKRKLRRLNRSGEMAFRASESPAGDMDEFFRLFRYEPEKAAFLTSARESFFRQLADELGGKGWLKLYFLEVQGKKIATTLCFDYRDTLYLYNSGYDPAYADLSAGLISKALTIREAIERGKKRFDFLRGVETYKAQLGGRPVSVYRFTQESEAHGARGGRAHGS